MPSPSMGGGPAAMPKYQRIAAALRDELDRAAHTAGGRLPSERTLAARYQVNRQTVRAALQHLREDGLVVTGRRGTRAVAAAGRGSEPEPAPVAEPTPVSPSVPVPVPVHAQCWLTLVTVPPSLAALLGVSGGEPTLVHHHRERGPAGQTLRHAVTYLSREAVARTPELARYRDRSTVARDEDLAPLHRWLDRSEVDGRVAETLTMTRVTTPSAAARTCGLTVRRTVHDTSGRLLAVTDLAFPTWDRLTFHRDRGDGGGGSDRRNGRDLPVTGFRVM